MNNDAYNEGFEHGMRTAAALLLVLILIIRFVL